MFQLSGVNYEEVLEQGDSILVRVIASSSYRGFELSGLYCIIILNNFKFMPVVLLNITCFNISMGKVLCRGLSEWHAKRKHSGDDDDQNESIYTPVFVFPSNPELKCR